MHMVELIVLMALKAFDGKKSIMGRTWLVMKTLEQHILSLPNQPFLLSSNLVNVVEVHYHGWRMLTTNLHYAKALFNPCL